MTWLTLYGYSIHFHGENIPQTSVDCRVGCCSSYDCEQHQYKHKPKSTGRKSYWEQTGTSGNAL